MACEARVHIVYTHSLLLQPPMWAQFTGQMTPCMSPNTLAFLFNQSVIQAVFPVLPGKNQSQGLKYNDWGIHIHRAICVH